MYLKAYILYIYIYMSIYIVLYIYIYVPSQFIIASNYGIQLPLFGKASEVPCVLCQGCLDLWNELLFVSAPEQ